VEYGGRGKPPGGSRVLYIRYHVVGSRAYHAGVCTGSVQEILCPVQDGSSARRGAESRAGCGGRARVGGSGPRVYQVLVVTVGRQVRVAGARVCMGDQHGQHVMDEDDAGLIMARCKEKMLLRMA
jgi:hypothetical protein